MNPETRKLLLELKSRNEQRLTELRGKIENNEVRDEDLQNVTDEIEKVTEELQDIADQLAEADEGSGEDGGGDGSDGTDNGEGDAAEGRSDGEGEGSTENREGMITQEQRDGLLGSIQTGLNTRGSISNEKRTKQIRSTFARFVVGQASESEARSFGIVNGNGAVTVPKEIVPELVSYTQELNPLRTDGHVVKTNTTQGYPVLVKKAKAQGHKDERDANDPIPDSAIELTEIELDPTEFDALALVTKKLMYRSDLPIEDIVMEELGKAYAEKEGVYFFRGDEVGNENPGALSKKAVQVFATKTIDDNGTSKVIAIDGTDGPEMYDALVDMKNSAKASIRRKSKWYLNDAAFAIIEKMKDKEGRPMYKPLEQLREGVDGRLLKYDVTVTEFADLAEDDTDTAVFYFGDPKSFHIQEVIGAMEVQRLVEKYADTNHIGLKIYNLLDGQLIYSPLEPTMYKLVIGTVPTP